MPRIARDEEGLPAGVKGANMSEPKYCIIFLVTMTRVPYHVNHRMSQPCGQPISSPRMVSHPVVVEPVQKRPKFLFEFRPVSSASAEFNFAGDEVVDCKFLLVT
ncbi:unnamed protein product [Calypogeia fissa]